MVTPSQFANQFHIVDYAGMCAQSEAYFIFRFANWAIGSSICLLLFAEEGVHDHNPLSIGSLPKHKENRKYSW